VPDSWNLIRGDDGNWTMDWAWPEPEPTPIPTIAWRMMHIAATGMANRTQAFFGEDPTPDRGMNDPKRYPASLPSTAADGIAYLENAYKAWMDGIGSLSMAEMERPLGPKGGQFAEDSMASLIVHINRETMHHGAEIGLLRDMYARRPD
jgi:DinB superfamily